MFLFFTVIIGGTRFQTAAVRYIQLGAAGESFKGDARKLIAGLSSIQEFSSEGTPVQLKLLQLGQVLSLDRHFNWTVLLWLYDLSPICLHYGIRAANTFAETRSVHQNIN